MHEREHGRSEGLDSDAGACLPCDGEPTDVSSPVATSSSNAPRQDGERLSAVARRLRSVTFAEPPADVVAFSGDQCGDPACIVKSRNGYHVGLHKYPPPAPRRARPVGR